MDFLFYKKKRQAFLDGIPNNSMIVLLSNRMDQKSIDKNFFYLVGIWKKDCYYLASKRDGVVDETLFIPRPNSELIKWNGQMIAEDEAASVSGIQKISYTESFEKECLRKLSSGIYNHVWLSLDPNSFSKCEPSYVFSYMLKERYPSIVMDNCYHMIAALRVFKSPEEIALMKKAMDITKKGFEAMMKKCRPGMYEYQLGAYFDFELAMEGVMERGFDSTIATGGNEFCLHYNELTGRISDGDLVLADCGAQIGGYCVDISRVFPASGRFSDRQRQIYSLALEANKAVMRIIKPGISFADVLETCKTTVYEGLKSLGLLKDYSEVSRYFWHGVAHYVGLDVHDVGRYDQPIDKDMVFTVDAGIYIPEWDIGLRVEDDILVNGNGCEHLSSDIPREIEDIECIMQ